MFLRKRNCMIYPLDKRNTKKQKNKDDMDLLGGIYWHISVFSLPLGNLEF